MGDIELRLINQTTLAEIAVLEGASAKGWRDELDEAGRGAFDIVVNDADYSLIQDGRLARYYLRGTPRWQGVIGPADRESVPFGEKEGPAGRKKRYELYGTLELFDTAPVYPELGLNRYSPEVRLFTPASKYFDVSGWANATALYRQDSTSSNPYASSPRGWKDPLAYWMWGQAESGSPPQPIGDNWFVKDFTMAAQKDCWFMTTADDAMAWYLDGGPLAREGRALMWGTTKAVGLLLDAGPHRLMCIGTNVPRDIVPSNRAAVLASLAEATNGGQDIGTVFVRTDSSWKTLAYPSVAPTMTPGHIVRVLKEEAQTGGYIPGITLGFTDTLDSAGNAWAIPVDVEYSVATDSLLSVLKQLGEVTVDVAMDPSSLRLDMWNKPRGIPRPTAGLVVGTSAGVGNLSGLRHSHVPIKANTAIVRLADGRYVERENAASVAAHGRKGVGLTLGTAASEDQSDRTVDALFASKVPATPQDRATVRIEGSPYAYQDFSLGDTLPCPKDDGTPGNLRAEAIVVGEDEAGYATVIIEGPVT